MLSIDPRGAREGIALIFGKKHVFEKHPSGGGGGWLRIIQLPCHAI